MPSRGTKNEQTNTGSGRKQSLFQENVVQM